MQAVGWVEYEHEEQVIWHCPVKTAQVTTDIWPFIPCNVTPIAVVFLSCTLIVTENLWSIAVGEHND